MALKNENSRVSEYRRKRTKTESRKKFVSFNLYVQ